MTCAIGATNDVLTSSLTRTVYSAPGSKSDPRGDEGFDDRGSRRYRGTSESATSWWVMATSILPASSSPDFVAVELRAGTAPGHGRDDAELVLGRVAFQDQHFGLLDRRRGDEGVRQAGIRQGEGGDQPLVNEHPVGPAGFKRLADGLHGVEFDDLLVAGDRPRGRRRLHQGEPSKQYRRRAPPVPGYRGGAQPSIVDW